MGVAVYNDADFKARFPEFAATPAPYLQVTFTDAGLFYLNNTDQSRVQDVTLRTSLLYLIVAHLAKLDPTVGGQETVGRISNATEGAVSVATDYVTKSESAAFWAQTQYGARYWAATSRFRSATYVPPPRRNMGVPGTPGGFGWRR